MGIKLKTHANHHTNRSKVEVKHFSRRLLQFQLQFHFHFHFNAVYGFSDFDRNANCGSAVYCDADAARNQRQCLLLFLQFVAKLHVVTTAEKKIITIARAEARNNERQEQQLSSEMQCFLLCCLFFWQIFHLFSFAAFSLVIAHL